MKSNKVPTTVYPWLHDLHRRFTEKSVKNRTSGVVVIELVSSMARGKTITGNRKVNLCRRRRTVKQSRQQQQGGDWRDRGSGSGGLDGLGLYSCWHQRLRPPTPQRPFDARRADNAVAGMLQYAMSSVCCAGSGIQVLLITNSAGCKSGFGTRRFGLIGKFWGLKNTRIPFH